MIDLVSYIRGMLKSGYPIEQIKGMLLQYGYPEQAIDQAIYALSHQSEVKHTIHITKSGLIAVVLLVMGAIVSSFFIFGGNTNSPKMILDVKIESVTPEVKPGEILTAMIDLSNMGSKSREDIYLKAEIFSESTKQRAAFKSETVALETTKSHNIEIKMPNDVQDGNYIFQVTARYGEASPKATQNFKVKSEKPAESCFDKIKNQGEEDIDCGGPCSACNKCPASCDDGNAMTIDTCDASTNFECKYERPQVCGDSVCSGTETESSCPSDCFKQTVKNCWDEYPRIEELAKTDPNSARAECDKIGQDCKDRCLQIVGEQSIDPNVCASIENQMEKERCFSNIARNLKRPALCENIEKESRRDSCYINFAVDGDYSICEKVSNQYLRKSCETLRQTSQ